MNALSPWLTSREAAAYLKLKEDTIRHARSRGSGPPFYRAGGRVLYNLTELDQWVRANGVTPSA